MTDVSPAAQAVKDAWDAEWPDGLAAALRAAADQTKQVIARAPLYDDWSKGWKDGATAITERLLAIATELEQVAPNTTTEITS
jgi:hypothetical protein